MLKRQYDPTQPYRYVEYGRMSDPGQNQRSPDQQFATIGETIKRLAYPWQKVRTYRDDGISGRYVRKRRGLQTMLRNIAVGLIHVDLVVCDTYERLGRAEEIAIIRHKLMTDHGVLVVTADSNFADPTGVVGKALVMVESVRSTEDGRIKSHNVVSPVLAGVVRRRGRTDARPEEPPAEIVLTIQGRRGQGHQQGPLSHGDVHDSSNEDQAVLKDTQMDAKHLTAMTWFYCPMFRFDRSHYYYPC